MRIEGAAGFEQRGLHRLRATDGSVVELVIASLPLDVDIAISRVLPEPRKPRRTTGMSHGQPVYEETETPEYRTDHLQWMTRLQAAIAYRGLRHETRIEWETTLSRNPTTDEIDRVVAEFAGIGLVGEEMYRLATAVRALGADIGARLEAAQADFLQRTAAGPTPG